jgi:O-methyltransferase
METAASVPPQKTFWSCVMRIIIKVIKNILPYYFVKKYYRILKKNVEVIDKRDTIICGKMLYMDRERKDFVFEYDYIRASAVELIANEIYDKNIDGSVAELGVYRGDFAKIINLAFPDRRLYLFDTFEGFDKRDIKTELENKFSTGEQDFSETSVELVLEKMKYKDNCVVRKGYFPETANGISELFSFVSIDCDLYDPMYSGLNYFYKNLNHGGYILLHDYNNKEYAGIKFALRKFSKENNTAYFPICDGCGSAVIMKP